MHAQWHGPLTFSRTHECLDTARVGHSDKRLACLNRVESTPDLEHCPDLTKTYHIFEICAILATKRKAFVPIPFAWDVDYCFGVCKQAAASGVGGAKRSVDDGVTHCVGVFLFISCSFGYGEVITYKAF